MGKTARIVGCLVVGFLALGMSGCSERTPETKVEPKIQQSAPLEPATQETLSITLPHTVGPADAFLASTDRLQIDDRVTLGQSPQITNVSNLGPSGLEFKAGVLAHANVYNRSSSTFLASNVRIRGFLRAGGAITKQNGVVVEGGEFPNSSIADLTSTWTVDFPTGNQGPVLVPPDQVRTLDPGSYGAVDLRSRARLFLRTGTYFLTSFNSEPESRIFVDKTNGPIFIYVKNSFRHYSLFVENGGAEGKLLLGFLGTSLVDVQTGFVGTIVAPKAEIHMRRPAIGQHKGAFFAKRIHIDSDAQVRHIPFDWTFICPLGDSDGDRVSDCTDQCARDPLKVSPGICGCGVPETNSDGDKVPNCKDECPNDPNNVQRGQCGCAGDPDVKVAGTPCTDGVCAGVLQCNGAGVCGNPTTCRPDPGCVPRQFDDKTYWVCPGRPWSGARTRCDSVSGQSLVKIDNPTENAFVASLISGPSWIGASDSSVEGAWRWSSVTATNGAQFWSGGAVGSTVSGRYANWSGGEPGGGDPSDCGAIQLGGRWTDESCALSLPYICETSIRTDPRPTGGPPCPFPFATCEGGRPRVTPCVPIEGPDQAEAEAQVRACAACESDQACVDVECVGAASEVTSGTCEPFTDEEKAFCEIVPSTAGAACSRANPTCATGTCGVVTRCHDVFKDGDTWRARSCTEGCQAGHFCGNKGFCVNPSLQTACDFATVELDECFGQCFTELACGELEPDCAANDEADPNPCEDVEVCSTPDVPNNDLDPGSDVEDEPLNPNDTFGPPSEPAGETYPSEDPPCPVIDGRVQCDLGENHPWCNYGVDGALGEKPVRDTKQGGRGSGAVVAFDFDPNVDLDFRGSPLPFGETDFFVRAAASFRATTTFDLGFASDTIEVIDAVAALEATRCRVNTNETRLEVFGLDFLPVLGIDAKLDSDEVFSEQDCEDSIGKFVDAAGRAKKALRDAQELMRQYQTLRDQGTNFALSLCDTLASEPPENFPPLPPGVTCEAEAPEATINRFIQFANEEAARIKVAQDQLNLETLSSATGFSLGLPAVTFDKSAEETQKIVNITFFVGPVPANLSVEAVLTYGLYGGLRFNLSPSAVLQDADTDIISVTAEAEPFANAGVSIFVGAGIDFGGLALKIGVAGNITLGNISLPAYAGAGIRVQPVNDTRDLPETLPADLQAMSSGQTAFPFDGKNKSYRYALGFRYGASFKLDQVLGGDIDARVKVKFFFFSKTWKKKIIDFGDGFSFGTVPLLNGGIELAIADDSHDWGLIRMPTPLVKLLTLSIPPIPEIGSGTTPSEPGDAAPDVGTAPVTPASLVFDTGRVEELFYDSLCTCKTEDQPCRRNDDCCPEAPNCFDHPDPAIGPVCTGCQAGGTACNEDADCCEGGCVGGTCVTCLDHNLSCSGVLPCCTSQDSCFEPIGQEGSRCTCVALGQRCRNLGECCDDANSCSDTDPDGGFDQPICRIVIQ